jgi:hypothetical protein
MWREDARHHDTYLDKADSSISGNLLDKRENIGRHKTNTEINLELSVTPSFLDNKLRLSVHYFISASNTH